MNIVPKRMSWDEYFMELIETIANRATCDRGRSGAVVVRDKRILTTGYVGSPPGQPHCDEAGHMMHRVIDENGNESTHCIQTIHAEANAVYQAAIYGIALAGSTLYCKMTPCYRCAQMIAAVGIKRVVAKRRYHAEALSLKIFEDAGIAFKVIKNEVEEYNDQ